MAATRRTVPVVTVPLLAVIAVAVVASMVLWGAPGWLPAAGAQTTTTLPEAPSSISGHDQVRGALVLGLTIAAMALLFALAARGARRVRRQPPVT